MMTGFMLWMSGSGVHPFSIMITFYAGARAGCRFGLGGVGGIKGGGGEWRTGQSLT